MSTTSVTTALVPITPLEIFLQLAAGSFEAIRAQNESKTYVPAQFGGIIGQFVVGNNSSIMQLTNFKVN